LYNNLIFNLEDGIELVNSLSACVSLVKCFLAGNQISQETVVHLADHSPLLVIKNIRLLVTDWKELERKYECLLHDEKDAHQEKNRIIQEKSENAMKDELKSLISEVAKLQIPREHGFIYDFINSLQKEYQSTAPTITKNSSESDIKKIYKSLALLCHSDKNKSAEAEERFKLLQAIHALLTTPGKKLFYDTKFIES
jgi:tRNA nucleotidyltransferase/poly(A) polymerase